MKQKFKTAPKTKKEWSIRFITHCEKQGYGAQVKKYAEDGQLFSLWEHNPEKAAEIKAASLYESWYGE